MDEKEGKVKDKIDFIRDHPELSIKELADYLDESAYFIRVVREVDTNPELQPGGT